MDAHVYPICKCIKRPSDTIKQTNVSFSELWSFIPHWYNKHIPEDCLFHWEMNNSKICYPMVPDSNFHKTLLNLKTQCQLCSYMEKAARVSSSAKENHYLYKQRNCVGTGWTFKIKRMCGNSFRLCGFWQGHHNGLCSTSIIRAHMSSLTINHW